MVASHTMRAAGLGLVAAAALALGGGCKGTEAAPAEEPEAAKVKAAAPAGSPVDQALAREGEKWMVDLAKRRTGPTSPAARPGSVPAGAPAATPK